MDREEIGQAILFIAVLYLVVVGFFNVVNFISKKQLIISCPKFAEASGYETKFVEYTKWNYSCLAKQDNGKWIDSSLLRGVSNSDNN